MNTQATVWKIYLSGEIHSDWRTDIEQGVTAAGLPVVLLGPNTVHADSDDAAAVILGEPESGFVRDNMGAKLNAMRTRKLIADADIVVVRFGDKYRQWNAAFDAGTAAALGKSLIIQHAPDLTHALKEVDASALAVAETPGQVVDLLAYVTTGALQR
jgi:YtoQ family protein